VFARPEEGVVSVTWVDASAITREDLRAALSQLPAAEVERFHRYRHAGAANQFLAGRLLLRQWLQALTGTAAAEFLLVEGERGRPAISHPPTAWSFNLAHSGGLVACALSLMPEVGVDLEHLDRRPMAPDLFRRFCSPAEIADIERQPEAARAQRFLTFWTLKEAYLKARGLGIAVPLAEVEFSVDGPTPEITFRGTLEGTDPGWAFALFQPTTRCLLSVAAPQPAGTRRPVFDVHSVPLEVLIST
jgi:4'-phosphopantetheinyl transferase